jgi:Uma2 family endonuclease
MSAAVAVADPPITPASEPEDTGARPRRWTRADYYRAAELGVFAPDERLELLEGEIIEKMTESVGHVTGIKLSAAACTEAFAGQSIHLSIQHPIALPGDSDPEPDVAVIAGSIRDYESGHPTPAGVLLLIEVSDTTLLLDRRRKAAAYAAAGIREYWILNLRDRRLEVYRDPAEGVYQAIISLGGTQTISPLAAPQATIAVADLLPSAA